MRNAQKPDHISLNTLINRLKEGRYVIPDFQREFEWTPWDIRDLMRSIFLDYYVGSLLLWKGKEENFNALDCEDVFGHTGANNREHIVLDGQQRLTAIYYAFVAPPVSLPRKAKPANYFIYVDKFMRDEHDAAFDYDWSCKRIDALLASHDAQYESHTFPISTIGAGGWALPNWVQGYHNYWKQKAATAPDAEGQELAEQSAKYAEAFGELLKGITEEYQISYIELDKEIEVWKVCDIFTKINSKGVRLDVFDLMNALLKPHDLQLKHMWRESQGRLDFVDSEKLNVYILQVMSIQRQAYCSPKYLYYLLPNQEKPVRENGKLRKEILVKSADDFKQAWTLAVNALEDAIKVLRHPHEYGAVSSVYLPYISILPAFAAIRNHASGIQPNRQIDAQRKIRHWYWASVFTSRYSGSVESTAARDYIDLKAWIEDDQEEPSLISEFSQQFKNLELRKEVRKGSSIYNGIFNLLVLRGARDWMTSNIPQHDDLDDHHIVPASWGKKHLKGKLIDSILNRTPLTADTNRKIISDKLPNEYLPELIKSNSENTVRSILESHFISPTAQSILMRKPFTVDDFEEFITERQKTFQTAIQELLIKERLDLSSDLREVDQKIEEIELGLRKVICEVLENADVPPPQHVMQKVKERITRESKKNAAFDSESYQSLKGQLEFFDLRELQDTIVAKAKWTLFAEKFANKEALGNKFAQLAAARNSIRHSRDLDQITKMEGEAAILWFEKVL